MSRSRALSHDKFEDRLDKDTRIQVKYIERVLSANLTEDYIIRLLYPYLIGMFSFIREDISRMVNEKILAFDVQRKKYIGIILLTILLSVSVLLSTLSYFLFNMPELGIERRRTRRGRKKS